MKLKSCLFAIAASVVAFGAPAAAFAQNKVNLGVAIPAATHSFTAGIVWWANEAKAELEKQYKDLKITIKTAANAGEQANQLQDLTTANKINALVIFPFESAALTKPVAQVKNKGVYVTVVKALRIPARRMPMCPATTRPSARSPRNTLPRRWMGR